MQSTDHLSNEKRARPPGTHSIEVPLRTLPEYAPKDAPKQERAVCIAANGNTTFDAVAEIIETIRTEHERTRHEIIKRLLPKPKTRERGGEITQEQAARDFEVSRETVIRWEMRQTANELSPFSS